eukprot:9063203-Pyramimonas_sp.AAC.1
MCKPGHSRGKTRAAAAFVRSRLLRRCALGPPPAERNGSGELRPLPPRSLRCDHGSGRGASALPTCLSCPRTTARRASMPSPPSA